MNRFHVSLIPLAVAVAAMAYSGIGNTIADNNANEFGGFQLTASLPGSTAEYGEAVLLVATRNCAEPKNASVSAKLVMVEDGRMTTKKLVLRNVGEGEYAVDQQWEDGVVAVVAVDGSYEKYTAGLIVGLDGEASFEGSGRWVGQLSNGYPTRLLDRNVRDRDLKNAIARLGD